MDLIGLLLVSFFGGGGIITALIVIREVRKHRPVKSAKCADYYVVADETKMSVIEDSFLRTHTTRVKVASSSAGKKR
jgi:hypothetical protein